MKDVDRSKLKRLPKWAQEYIKSIEREREETIKTLNEFRDNQTPSEFYCDRLVCTGEKTGPSVKRHYFSASQGRLVAAHAGVKLEIILRDGLIDLSYGREDDRIDLTPAILQPVSWNRINLSIPKIKEE